MIRIDWRGFAFTRENSVYQAVRLLGPTDFFMAYKRSTGHWPNTLIIRGRIYR